MRVLLISQYYFPEPVEKVHDLAAGLVKLGHDVTVLTGFPCYPIGEIFEGYRGKFIQVEEIDGVKVVRTIQFPDHSMSAFRRAVYYLTFPISSSVVGYFIKPKPDVILVYLAALPVGLAARFLSRILGVPYVLDVVDLWPESVQSSGMLTNSLIDLLITRIAKSIYNEAAAISVVTDGFGRNIIGHGVDPKKVTKINNWMPEKTYQQVSNTRRLPLDYKGKIQNKFVVMYAGNIGPYQDVKTIVDAAALLREDKSIIFSILGGGTQYNEIVNHARMLNLENVAFLGRRQPEEMPEYMATADVLIVHLKPSILSDISIPSKTYSYMASGKPVIMAVQGEAGDFVEENGFGISINPCDPPQMAEAIKNIKNITPGERKALGDSGLRNYQEKYSGGVLVKEFERILMKVIPNR